MEFINNLTINKDVLDKTFYVVIPESGSVVQKTSGLKIFFGKMEKVININTILDEVKPRLNAKRDHFVKQFKNIGLTAFQLNNEALIRLYYSMYDPDKAGISKLELSTTQYTSTKLQTK